jgi:hypothetical protein
MSIIGTVLPAIGSPYYSPTFGRGGMAATFLAEIFAVTGTFTIDVEHKNVEDTSWTTLCSFPAIAAGIKDTSGSPIKEQLRFKYLFTAFSAGDAVYFNMMAPAWRPY